MDSQETAIVSVGGVTLAGAMAWLFKRLAPWISSIYAGKETAEIAAAKVAESAAKQVERLENEAKRLSEKLEARDKQLDEIEAEKDKIAEELRDLKSKIGSETSNILTENRTLKKRIAILESDIEAKNTEIQRLKKLIPPEQQETISSD